MAAQNWLFKVNYKRIDSDVEYEVKFPNPRKLKKYLKKQMGIHVDPHKKYSEVIVTQRKKRK